MEDECKKYLADGEEIVLGPSFGNGEKAINYIRKHHVDV